VTPLHPIVLLKPPSAEQLPAVETVDRDVVLTAGAGTGKTRTLVARILHLLATGVPTRAIVAVTFTVKAAREMRNRLRQEIGDYLATPGLDAAETERWSDIYAELDAARIGTIHSLCGEILRAHPAEANVDPAFPVLEEAAGVQLRAEAIGEALGWAAEDADAARLFALFSADTLHALLDDLLSDRLKAETLFAARAWEEWPQRALSALISALGDSELKAAAGTILGWEEDGTLAGALAAGDTLAPALRDFPIAWQALAGCRDDGDLPGAVAAIQRLRDAVPGGKGKPANWGGDDPKPVTRAFREAYDATIKPLVNGVDPALDGELAALMPQLERLFTDAQTRYRARKAERHALDFDDLEQQALDLLAGDDDVRARWQEEVESLLVDEFQDTNGRQRDLVKYLNAGRGRLFIVGDAKQSIYRFRGAEVEVFREERAAIAQSGRVCDMSTSFRTHTQLVGALNALLSEAMGTETIASEPWREPFMSLTAARVEPAFALPAPYVEFHLATGSKADGALDRSAAAVAARLRELVAASDGRLDWGDVAVLCRTSRGFGPYEDAFEAAGIPYETVAGRGFLNRPEVRDLLNALQAVTDPTDDLALYGLLRSPAIGLSDPDLHRLRLGEEREPRALWPALCADDTTQSRHAVALIEEMNGLAGRVTVADLLKHFVDATGYRGLLLAAGDTRAARNVSKLLLDAQRSGIVSAGAFLEYVSGLRAAGSREGEARADSSGAVQIMSVHQAKGLEFPVIVIGDAGGGGGGRSTLLLDGELGIIPALSSDAGAPLVWKLAMQREASKEDAESDRLLYVAATRARERLLISGHVTVRRDGSLGPGNWLKDLCEPAGLTHIPAGFDADGAEPAALSPDDGAVAAGIVSGVLYPAGYVSAAEPLQGRDDDTPDAAEHARLLEPVVTMAATDAGTTPERVWRVIPRAAQRWAPRWVIGTLVHAAIAEWRFPDAPGFDGWCRAQARSYGLLDDARLGDAVQRTRRLLANFRRHPLYAAIDGAVARHHELPYATPGGEQGRIDLLFRVDGGPDAGWTLVDFKSDRLASEQARAALVADEGYRAQIERYAAAVEALLGVRPRCLLCLLDDRGACSVVPVGAQPAPSAAVDPGDAAWQQAVDLADPALAPLLAQLREAGWPAPEVGLDIADGRGRIVAGAELAWPERRVAVFVPGQESDLLLAGQAKWRTFLADDVAACAAALLALDNVETTR